MFSQVPNKLHFGTHFGTVLEDAIIGTLSYLTDSFCVAKEKNKHHFFNQLFPKTFNTLEAVQRI
jgi:hypothetical protein